MKVEKVKEIPTFFLEIKNPKIHEENTKEIIAVKESLYLIVPDNFFSITLIFSA